MRPQSLLVICRFCSQALVWSWLTGVCSLFGTPCSPHLTCPRCLCNPGDTSTETAREEAPARSLCFHPLAVIDAVTRMVTCQIRGRWS